ncbi:hypothetical protein ACMYSQ_005846 [Aspergillus niger]
MRESERKKKREKVERESGKKLQVDVKFPLSKANRPGLPTSQKPTNNGDTGTVLVIFFTEGLPAEWRRKAKLSAEKKEKPMDPADDSVGLTQLTTWGPPSLPAANPVVRKEQRQKEVPFGCSILYFLPKYFAAFTILIHVRGRYPVYAVRLSIKPVGN